MTFNKQLAGAAFALASALSITPATATSVGDTPFLTDPGLQVAITGFRPVLRFGGRRPTLGFDVEVVIRNDTEVTVDDPLRVAANVNREVLNADGFNDDGVPVVDVCVESCVLAPGAKSAPATVQLGGIARRGRDRVFPSLTAEYEADRLQLLHFADADGTGGALQNVVPFSAILNALRAELPDETLVLSSGDNFIPGPRFAACEDASLDPLIGIAGQGRCDIAFVNAFDTEASAVGNHELDLGTAVFASQIAQEFGADGSVYEGAQFPYLSANLDFGFDANLAALVAADAQPAESIPNSLAGSTLVEVNGETIGVVGATTPQLDQITSTGDIGIRPADGTDIPALAAEIQAAVDELLAFGVDKVVLLAHMQQIAIEKELATLLEGVDIIVAGGSNTLLADETDTLRVGDTAADTYPLLFDSAAGAPVALVNVDGDYRYLGRLVSVFDLRGELVTGLLDPAVNGAFATDETGLGNVGNPAPLAPVEDLSDALTAVLAARDGNIFGSASVFLDGRRSQVRTEETNLGNLTADANLALARTLDPAVQVSIKNGGGIRAAIGRIEFPPGSTDPDDAVFLPTAPNPAAGKEEGDISQFDIQQTLRFDNELVLMDVTAAELKELIEHAVAATEPGATPGQFPQVGGLAFSFDPAGTPRTAPGTGTRVQSLAVLNAGGGVADVIVENGVVQGDPSRVIRVVTLNFLANGGDGYPFPLQDDVADDGCQDPLTADPTAPRCDLVDSGLVATGAADFSPQGGEQDALAEFIAANFAAMSFDLAETPVAEDERIQNLAERSDTVLTQ